MLISLALVFLVGLAAAALTSALKLPRIVGMLFAGILLGPYVLNWLDPAILAISGELRQMALIIILLKAGLSLDLSDLKKVGRQAALMAFLPASFEILAFVLFAPVILGISHVEAALMGAVMGAVSPAIVVPRMVKLIDERRGTEQSIPQLILAGASCDDVFVIVIFTALTGIAQGGEIHAGDFAAIPVSMLSGVALGVAAGILLALLFEFAHNFGKSIRDSEKAIILLGTAFLLMAAEKLVKQWLPLSGLLAVVSSACTIKIKTRPEVSAHLSDKFGKLWLAAEVILFVLVGAAVDIRCTAEAGPAAVGMIFLALAVRCFGVLLCVLRTALTRRERLFCALAYLPKATVQAAIGSVPLTLGLSCGNLILSVAVLGILITAPLGAFAIDISYRKLLSNN